MRSYSADDPRRTVDLGPCCGCQRPAQMVGFLDRKAAIRGHGWGCLQCDLPPDGAMVVLCNDCLESRVEPVWACAGYPATEGRIPIAELVGSHRHDLEKHPEIEKCCRECGCTDLAACVDPDLGPCWWIEADLCSHCLLRLGGSLPA